MRLLLLGPEDGRAATVVHGVEVVGTEVPVTADDIVERGIDLVLSWGYRHIVAPDVLAACGGRAFNVHISMLPWNRGAAPNLWSWLEHTPKGVSVHVMSEGLDRGDLVAQRVVDLDGEMTLRSSYDTLQDAAAVVLGEVWPDLLAGTERRTPQPSGGTSHRAADAAAHSAALPDGWDTRCGAVEEYGRSHGLWVDAR